MFYPLSVSNVHLGVSLEETLKELPDTQSRNEYQSVCWYITGIEFKTSDPLPVMGNLACVMI